jgi:hypothetical protein
MNLNSKISEIKKSLVETIKEELSEEDKINIIMKQTNYDNETCIKLLDDYDGDHISIIKKYLGIEKKETKIKSINQEIYKQLRYKLNESNELVSKLNNNVSN